MLNLQTTLKTRRKEQPFKAEFDNRLIVIDEVHNMKPCDETLCILFKTLDR